MDTAYSVFYFTGASFLALFLCRAIWFQVRYLRRRRAWRRDLSDMRTQKQWWGQR